MIKKNCLAWYLAPNMHSRNISFYYYYFFNNEKVAHFNPKVVWTSVSPPPAFHVYLPMKLPMTSKLPNTFGYFHVLSYLTSPFLSHQHLIFLRSLLERDAESHLSMGSLSYHFFWPSPDLQILGFSQCSIFSLLLLSTSYSPWMISISLVNFNLHA